MQATHQALGDFALDEIIGRGGMGVVYRAEQVSLGRPVALKILPQEFTADPQRLERFRREAEVISRLDHPSIVPVYAVGEDLGVHYIAMKLLHGQTLDAVIRSEAGQDADPSTDTMVMSRTKTPSRGEWPALEVTGMPNRARSCSVASTTFQALRIGEKLARALQHAHERGIIHRDVKPSNVLVDTQGQPWLLDFGLVRDLRSNHTLTTSGSFCGTAYYMAPEQVTGDRDRQDHRADIYSLGVTLYELVTGTRPFNFGTPDTLFHAIVRADPVPPRRLNPHLPRDLDTVLLKAMAKDPVDRYQSAEDFAEDLGRVRTFQPIAARRASLPGRARKWVQRNPAVAGALLFAALSFVGMVEYSFYRNMQDGRRAIEALERADLAYEDGHFQEATTQYQLYLMLGGDADVVAPRLRSLGARYAEPPRRVTARGPR